MEPQGQVLLSVVIVYSLASLPFLIVYSIFHCNVFYTESSFSTSQVFFVESVCEDPDVIAENIAVRDISAIFQHCSCVTGCIKDQTLLSILAHKIQDFCFNN